MLALMHRVQRSEIGLRIVEEMDILLQVFEFECVPSVCVCGVATEDVRRRVDK